MRDIMTSHQPPIVTDTARPRFLFVTTLLGNTKGPVELDIPNTCAEVKLCLFLFMPAQEIVCRKTEVLKTVSSGYVQMDLLKKPYVCK